MTQFGAGAIGASINAANIGNTGRQVRQETRRERERRLQQAANDFDPDSLSGTRERMRGFRRQRLIENGIDPDRLDRRLDENQTSVERLRRDRVQLGQKLRDAEASGDNESASRIRQEINLIADAEDDLLNQRREVVPLARATLADLPDEERLELRRQGREDLNAQLSNIADANRRAEDRDFGARLSREADAGRDLLRRAGGASLAREVSDERAAEFFRGADPAEQDVVLRGVPLPEADRSTSDRIQSIADEGGVDFPEIGPGRTALDRPGGAAAASRLADSQLDAETRRNIAERLQETQQDRLLRTAENTAAEAENRARELAVEALNLEAQGDLDAARRAMEESVLEFQKMRAETAARLLEQQSGSPRGGGQGGDSADSGSVSGSNPFFDTVRNLGIQGDDTFALAFNPGTVIDNIAQALRNDNPEAIQQIRTAIQRSGGVVGTEDRRRLAEAVIESIEESGVQEEVNTKMTIGDTLGLMVQGLTPGSEAGGAFRRDFDRAFFSIFGADVDTDSPQAFQDRERIQEFINGEAFEEFERLLSEYRSIAGRE